MTSFELGNLIKSRLNDVELAQYLDDTQEQYLEFPDGFFAEIVLKDGSKLPDVQMMVKSIEEELRKQGIELDAIVRAMWKVGEGWKIDVSPPGSAGVQRFGVTLRSGDRTCGVTVDMTGNALATVLRAFDEGGLREYGANRDAALVGIVREFVRLELSYGGESYWDPTLHPELTLNENALSYLTMHSPAQRS